MLCLTRRPVVPFVLILTMLSLAGCIMPATPTAQEQAAAQATAIQEIMPTVRLAGTSWQLESFGNPEDNVPALPGLTSTLNFLASRYGGYAGCNWYLGVYEVGESTIRLGTPAQSRTYCPDPAANDQEAMFLSALTNIVEYQLEGDKLFGYATGHQLTVTLLPAEPVPLEGTVWQLTFINDGKLWQPLILDTTITAQFDGDQLSGSAGCNDYSAAIERGTETGTIEGIDVMTKTLTIGELTVGSETCAEPRGVMEQEERFLTTLRSAASYVDEGNTLAIYDAGLEPLLVFGARHEAE
jgi:heat shock protein HslJ